MPKSRVNKDRKKKVEDYKLVKQIEKQILKNMADNNTPSAEVPQELKVRNVPKWKGNEILELTGIEFEALYNGSIKQASAILDSIMTRNVINGKILIDFEKLKANGTDYEEMTAEEQAPFKEEFKQWIEGIRNAKPKDSNTDQQPGSTPPETTDESPKDQAVVIEMK